MACLRRRVRLEKQKGFGLIGARAAKSFRLGFVSPLVESRPGSAQSHYPWLACSTNNRSHPTLAKEGFVPERWRSQHRTEGLDPDVFRAGLLPHRSGLRSSHCSPDQIRTEGFSRKTFRRLGLTEGFTQEVFRTGATLWPGFSICFQQKAGGSCAGGGCLLAGAPGEGKGEERRGWTWLARRLHESLSGFDAISTALTSRGQIGQVRFASGDGEPGGCVASRVWWIELRVMPDQRRSWAGGRRLARKVSRRYVPQ